MSELLQQVRVIDPVSGKNEIADVSIADGVIEAIAPQLSDYPSDAQVRDGRGTILGPGLVDLYSHSGEPGFEERETLASLMQASAAGGFTRIAILPDTQPAVDNPGTLAWLHQKAQAVIEQARRILPAPALSPPHLHFWGALTLNVKGEQMTELAELISAGVVGFADAQPIENLGLLRRVLEYLQPLGKPVAIWPGNKKLAGNGVAREGAASIRFGLPGNPAFAETAALAAVLELVAAIGTPVHVMRVSTKRSVELIQDAKARGCPVTASTTWMHLLLNTQDIGDSAAFIPYDPSLRLNPPLGNPEDREALIAGVKEGVIDAIAIDHTPYSYEEKTVAFSEAPAGAIGLELALPLLWQHLVQSGKLTELELWRALSHRPALCLKQKPAAIAPGEPAELTLFDPQQPWSVNPHHLKSLSTNTPWLGQELVGRVVQTWCPKQPSP